jgi:hypothetical protein
MAMNRDGRLRHLGGWLQRAGLLLILVLSIAGVLLSLLGLVAVWRVRPTLTESGTTNLARVSSALTTATTGLQTIQASLDAIDEAQIADAGRTIAALPDILVSLNTTLLAVNEIPFVSVPTIDLNQLQGVAARLANLSTRIEAARQRRAEAGGSASADTELQAIRTAAADLTLQVSTAQARVDTAREHWPRWIDRAALGLTLLLAWLALAQAALGRLAWARWRAAVG